MGIDLRAWTQLGWESKITILSSKPEYIFK